MTNSNEPLALEVARTLIDKKAQNVVVLDVAGISSFASYFVIGSGFSDRQLQAMADTVASQMKQKKLKPMHVEGSADGNWVLLDCDEVIVHLFLDASREYYDLESLWKSAKKVSIPQEYYGLAH